MRRLFAATAVIAFLLSACGKGNNLTPTSTASAPPSPTSSPSPNPTPTSSPWAGMPPILEVADLAGYEPGSCAVQFLYDTVTRRLFRTWWRGGWSADQRLFVWRQPNEPDWGGGAALVDLESATASTVNSTPSNLRWALSSPNGSKIVYFVPSPDSSVLDERTDMYFRELEGSQSTLIDTELPFYAGSSWSPDSRFIAYYTRIGARVYDTIGGRDVLLPGTEGSIDQTWSPTEDVLAYDSGEGLFAFDAISGRERQIVAGDVDPPLLWSPDGSRLIVRHGQVAPIKTLAGEAMKPAAVSLDGAVVQLPQALEWTWSPDGLRVAYKSGDGSEIRLYTIATGDDILVGDVRGRGLAWSPDGRTLGFNDGEMIALYDVASAATALLDFSAGLQPDYIGSIGWSPDSRYLQIDKYTCSLD